MEHLDGLEGRHEKNALWKHSAIYHGGKLTKEDLKMEVVEGHRSPLNRQIHEGVEIETNAADVIMNSKGEWGHCKIPRVVIEVGDTVEEDETNGISRSTESRDKERSRGGSN